VLLNLRMANNDTSESSSSQILKTNVPEVLTVDDMAFATDSASKFIATDLSLGVLSFGSDGKIS
jgi:hypothetical protein